LVPGEGVADGLDLVRAAARALTTALATALAAALAAALATALAAALATALTLALALALTLTLTLTLTNNTAFVFDPIPALSGTAVAATRVAAVDAAGLRFRLRLRFGLTLRLPLRLRLRLGARIDHRALPRLADNGARRSDALSALGVRLVQSVRIRDLPVLAGLKRVCFGMCDSTAEYQDGRL
jgi:hypothetical protein